MKSKHIDIRMQPLLDHSVEGAKDPIFGPPLECSTGTRAIVDTLNSVHRSWEGQNFFKVDTRMSGLPAPLSVIHTPKERKSPNALANYARRRFNAPPSANQAQKRAAMRLLRDAILATIRYYGLEPHAFDIPTDTDILTWSPTKVRGLMYATREQLFGQILASEWPEAMEDAAHTRPQLALRVGIVEDAQAPEGTRQECYVAFTKPKPFWRRVGEPLFVVPIMASGGASVCLFAASGGLPRTFSQRGRVRFERVGPGEFVVQQGQAG